MAINSVPAIVSYIGLPKLACKALVLRDDRAIGLARNNAFTMRLPILGACQDLPEAAL